MSATLASFCHRSQHKSVPVAVHAVRIQQTLQRMLLSPHPPDTVSFQRLQVEVLRKHIQVLHDLVQTYGAVLLASRIQPESACNQVSSFRINLTLLGRGSASASRFQAAVLGHGRNLTSLSLVRARCVQWRKPKRWSRRVNLCRCFDKKHIHHAADNTQNKSPVVALCMHETTHTCPETQNSLCFDVMMTTRVFHVRHSHLSHSSTPPKVSWQHEWWLAGPSHELCATVCSTPDTHI